MPPALGCNSPNKHASNSGGKWSPSPSRPRSKKNSLSIFATASKTACSALIRAPRSGATCAASKRKRPSPATFASSVSPRTATVIASGPKPCASTPPNNAANSSPPSSNENLSEISFQQIRQSPIGNRKCRDEVLGQRLARRPRRHSSGPLNADERLPTILLGLRLYHNPGRIRFRHPLPLRRQKRQSRHFSL